MRTIDTHSHVLTEETAALLRQEAPKVPVAITPIDHASATLDVDPVFAPLLPAALVDLALVIRWVAPVLAPSIVSITISSTGLLALARPVRMLPGHWGVMILGGALILMSFMWDYQNLSAGGLPRPFAWRLFGTGELLGVAAFFHAFRSSPDRRNI